MRGASGGGAVYISATNGKTTTARLLSACLRADGRDVTANAAGANLASGVTSALLARERHRGAGGESTGCGGIGVFEVDEGALPQVAGALQPRAVVLMNLFRDQLDRYGELETIAERWDDLARSSQPGSGHHPRSQRRRTRHWPTSAPSGPPSPCSSRTGRRGHGKPPSQRNPSHSGRRRWSASART